ncbi:MAG: hypothetical protein LBI94_04805 [Treponema sp.]|jgi:hypothetical protein|nr:hypothetical protein [Treponema sp.]
MANNAYFLRDTGEETECLFESHVSIPFFWFALINTRVIGKLGEEILRLFRRSARRIMSNSQVTIRIPGDYMLKNAKNAGNFFGKFYPSLAPLYGEFAAYLAAAFRGGDTLELNIIEISDFNTTVRSMHQVRDVVRSIQLREDAGRYFEIYGPDRDPLSLTGDDRHYRNEFRKFSAAYGSYCDSAEQGLRRKPGVLEKLGKFKETPGGLRGKI